MSQPALQLVPSIKASPKHRYLWDPETLRYFDRDTKRYVSARIILALLERRIRDTKSAIREITDRFVAGDIDLADWQIAVARLIKDEQIHAAAMGIGGFPLLTPRDLGILSGNLREQYDKLEAFAARIRQGKLSPAQIQSNAAMYAGAAWTAYHRSRLLAARDAGYSEERRILDPNAANCVDCIGYEGMGWQPLGVLPRVGTMSVCQDNCRCTTAERRPEEARLAQLT